MIIIIIIIQEMKYILYEYTNYFKYYALTNAPIVYLPAPETTHTQIYEMLPQHS
jgi:hypothetical protein